MGYFRSGPLGYSHPQELEMIKYLVSCWDADTETVYILFLHIKWFVGHDPQVWF